MDDRKTIARKESISSITTTATASSTAVPIPFSIGHNPTLKKGNGKRVIAHYMTACVPELAMPDRPLFSWKHPYEVAASYGVNELTVFMEGGCGEDLVDNVIKSAPIAEGIPGFSISICLGVPRSDLMRDWLPVLKQWCEAAKHSKGIATVDGRPIVWTYHAGAASLDQWKELIEALHQAGYSPYIIGDMYAYAWNQKEDFLENVDQWASILDGLYFFGSEVKDERLDALLRAEDTRHHQRIVTVGGGYWRWSNDSQGESQLYHGTQRLEDDWNFASNPKMRIDWVHLATWNDYLEHTMFEPTRNRSDLYGEITREHSMRMKGIPRIPEEKYWLTAPSEVRDGPEGNSEYTYEVRGQDIPKGQNRTVYLTFKNDRGETIRGETAVLTAENHRFAFEWKPQADEFKGSKYLLVQAEARMGQGSRQVASLPILIWPKDTQRMLYKAPRSIRFCPPNRIPPSPQIGVTDEGRFTVKQPPATDAPRQRFDILYNMFMKGAQGVCLGRIELGADQLPEGGMFDPYYYQSGFRQAATITRDGLVSWALPLWNNRDLPFPESQTTRVPKTALTSKANTPIRINFQPGTAAPKGYLVDCGLEFGDRENGYFYGWSRNVQAFARNRKSTSDFLHNSNIPTGYIISRWYWKIAVPNGKYRVRLSTGDADYMTNKGIVIQGIQHQGEPPRIGTFQKHDVECLVQDEFLKIESLDTPTPLCFLEISRL